MRNASLRLASLLASLILALAACSPPVNTTDASGTDIAMQSDGSIDVANDSRSDVVSGPCRSDNDCTDGTFCNGAELCMPGASNADSRGCVAANPATPCGNQQRCDETMMRCISSCPHAPDADGDGHNSSDCGGDDCDDNDPNRFPGHAEVCDAMNHDEDCDGRTFGFRDVDMDGYVDAQCCNSDSTGHMVCGDDCNDSRANVHPALAEVCDGLDNDCNGSSDEGVEHTFHPDADSDGFGTSGGTSMTGCIAPMGYAEATGDCDDTRADVHPGLPELCDTAMIDENCDGMANPASLCQCSGETSQPCMQSGACASGRQQCVNGSWGACSIQPVAEVCNGIDDNCDGTVDETLSVICYADGDNDGYAATGAAAQRSCPVPGRDAFAGCPPNQTNRAPIGVDIDCNDADSTVSPGQPELCDASMRDENCDGVVNPPALCMCTEGATRPCSASGSCGAGNQTCSGGHWSTCSVNPVAESCNAIDDNCNGMTDEGLTVTCYPDSDNDGYAAASAMAIQSCPVAGRDGVGGCPTNQTNRAPSGASIDCNDANSAVSPGATELCDTGMVDENCDGMANPSGLCACSGTSMRTCTLPGACAAGTQTCAAGQWGNCSILPVAERCNGVDDDCDGMVDQGVTVQCYPDADNDGYAATGATVRASCPVSGREAVGGCPTNQTNRAPLSGSVDCNDSNAGVSPGAVEACDAAMVDENCDGSANPSSLCACSGTASRACPLSGACAAGTQTCSGGSWGSCSILPVAEVCNGIDDNCNGTADEMLTVSCFADADNDGYAAMGALASPQCPVAGRSTVGGCPTSYTNRAPTAGNVDCNDSDSSVNPGAPELCDAAMRDENCDGTANPAALCACSGNATRACPQPGACAAGSQMCVSGGWGSCSISPVTESCNGVDDNCNGMTDEGTTISCYADMDNDTYAPMGAMVSNVCSVAGRAFVGGCPPGLTNRAPVAGAIDCLDSDATVNPSAAEQCDAAMRDENCDGMANPASLCACSGSVTRACPLPGACAAGTQTCSSGQWGACSISPVAESCNSVDDNCNGMTDEGTTVVCYVDADNDTYALAGAMGNALCPVGGRASVGGCNVGYTNRAPSTAATQDCVDTNAARSPGATETCNGIDDDCDGMIDEGALTTFYRDADADGFGSPTVTMAACAAPPGYVGNSLDCDDTSSANRPGGIEICDGIDNDCDSMTDEAGSEASCYPGVQFTNWRCSAGTCQVNSCATNHANCDGMAPNGCEADLMTDARNCNACGTNCGVGGVCTGGTCDDPAQVSAGFYHTCVRRSSGNVACFGNNVSGQLGLGNLTEQTTPAWVTDLTGVQWVETANVGGDTSGGGEHTCVMTNDGTFCAGRNTTGELGDGTFIGPRTRFTQTSPCGTSSCQTSALALGGLHTCAAQSFSDLYCWGSDQFEQIGDGAGMISRATPQFISYYTDVGAGGNHTCAVAFTSDVYCWGLQSFGALGNNVTTSTNAATAQRVCATSAACQSGGVPLNPVDQVESGYQFNCARKTDGTVWCWGFGTIGQGGDGTIVNHPFAVRVGTLTNISQITVGGWFGCGLRSTDSTVWCWGSNNRGQIGDGTMTDRPSPVQVRTSASTFLTNVVEVNAGGQHACARTSNNDVYCWGYNGFGQLGLGDHTNRMYATRVPTL